MKWTGLSLPSTGNALMQSSKSKRRLRSQTWRRFGLQVSTKFSIWCYGLTCCTGVHINVGGGTDLEEAKTDFEGKLHRPSE